MYLTDLPMFVQPLPDSEEHGEIFSLGMRLLAGMTSRSEEREGLGLAMCEIPAAIMASPRFHANILVSQGMIYYHSLNLEIAEDCLEKALEIAPPKDRFNVFFPWLSLRRLGLIAAGDSEEKLDHLLVQFDELTSRAKAEAERQGVADVPRVRVPVHAAEALVATMRKKPQQARRSLEAARFEKLDGHFQLEGRGGLSELDEMLFLEPTLMGLQAAVELRDEALTRAALIALLPIGPDPCPDGDAGTRLAWMRKHQAGLWESFVLPADGRTAADQRMPSLCSMAAELRNEAAWRAFFGADSE